MSKPAYGHTRKGFPVHAHTWDHHDISTAYARFNKKVAVTVTRFVGSMTCAWIFCCLSLVSLPAVLATAFGWNVFPHWLVAVGLIALVAWIAQTFLQLVLLSVIMVGSNVQQEAADARAAKQFEDVEEILDKMNFESEGGLTVLEEHLSKQDEVLKQIRDILGKGES